MTIERTSLLLATILAGCVTETTASGTDTSDTELVDTQSIQAPDSVIAPTGPDHATVRDTHVSCDKDPQGRDLLSITTQADLDVAFAFAELKSGPTDFALDLPQLLPVDTLVIGSTGTVIRNTTFISGRQLVDATSPISCDRIADFGVKVQVQFKDGRIGCTLTGNSAELAGLVCE